MLESSARNHTLTQATAVHKAIRSMINKGEDLRVRRRAVIMWRSIIIDRPVVSFISPLLICRFESGVTLVRYGGTRQVH